MWLPLKHRASPVHDFMSLQVSFEGRISLCEPALSLSMVLKASTHVPVFAFWQYVILFFDTQTNTHTHTHTHKSIKGIQSGTHNVYPH